MIQPDEEWEKLFKLLWKRHIQDKVILDGADLKVELDLIITCLRKTTKLVMQDPEGWSLWHTYIYAIGCRMAKMKEEGKDFQELSLEEYIRWDSEEG